MDAVASFFTDTMSGGVASGTNSGTARANQHRNSFVNDHYGTKENGVLSGTSAAAKETVKNTKESSSGGLAGLLGSAKSGQQLLTEKFVEKMIYMALPSVSHPGLGKKELTSYEYRMAAAKNRSGLSVQIMSKNFIAMNSRLSVPFLILDEIIKLLNWENSNFTLVVLIFVSYIILKPIPTLTSVPIFYILFGIMVPAYMHLHKPDEWNTVFDNNPVPANGPNLVDVELPKPVPEFSKEFILNLTDLQNHMSIYVVVFDIINKILCKFAFYSREPLSISIFIVLLGVAVFNALYMDILSTYIPFKLITLVLLWGFSISMHPEFRDRILNYFSSEDTRLRWVLLSSRWEKQILKSLDVQTPEPKDLKVACIYEIQKYNDELKAWELVGYCNDDYSLFSDLRIQEIDLSRILKDQEHNNNSSGKNTSLQDVNPPKDWCWCPKSQWNLDLNVTKWVKENLLQCVEIDEEEKWVYDLNFPDCLARGEYRRRRWIRACNRKSNISATSRKSSATSAPNGNLNDKNTLGNLAATNENVFEDSDDEDQQQQQQQQGLMNGVLPRDLLSGVTKSPK